MVELRNTWKLAHDKLAVGTITLDLLVNQLHEIAKRYDTIKLTISLMDDTPWNVKPNDFIVTPRGDPRWMTSDHYSCLRLNQPGHRK